MEKFSQIVPLTTGAWSLAIDPGNVGREEHWYTAPRPEAIPTRLPGVMQQHYPDYHGVAWYWLDFSAPLNPHTGGRCLLRFQAVDHLAEVWLNGCRIGSHAGLEDPFTLDVTSAIALGSENRLAVRVLNPTEEAIDGMTMWNTHLGRRENGRPGDHACNTGGIIDAVELLLAPVLRIENLQVIPDWSTGRIRVRAQVCNAGDAPLSAYLRTSVAPAVSGESIDVTTSHALLFPVGSTVVEAELLAPHHRLWELDDPFLYRVSAQIRAVDSDSIDEYSVRFGFRDFRFERGYFRINGRRIRLHGALYTILNFPITMSVPLDSEMMRKDVYNMKMMGFNSVRITCGAALPARQLDIFDEVGLLVCQEHMGATHYARHIAVEGANTTVEWDAQIAAVIRRDRNHPSIVIWSLLNEVKDSILFRHVVANALEQIRELDDTRIVLLNSGRDDGKTDVGSWSSPGSRQWENIDLCDTHRYIAFPHSSGDSLMMRSTNFSSHPEEKRPILLSEFGVCGAENYERLLRQYEQRGYAHAADAQVYQAKYAAFMDDWRKWRLDECWAVPADYFRESERLQATLMLDDYNSWMANPLLVGSFSSTTINDTWFHGCGATTFFRELKPGMADAYADMGAKVRLCLFVEPVNVYRGSAVKFEAVLSNLDALPAGEYPARMRIIGPNVTRIHDELFTVTIPENGQQAELPFTQMVFSRDVLIDGPVGRYRFLVNFERGAAASGGEVEFYVDDAAAMPCVAMEIALWGDDEELAEWLTSRGIRWQRLDTSGAEQPRVILVSGMPPAPGGAVVFAQLEQCLAGGSTVVFLTNSTLVDWEHVSREANGENPLAYPMQWAPFPGNARPSVTTIRNTGYMRPDYWAKNHPLFAEMPSGGLLDCRYYREIISPWVLVDLPSIEQALCGAISASGERLFLFRSDLLVSVHQYGAGRFILNTLNIRENLGTVPAAERLLRNMLNYNLQ